MREAQWLRRNGWELVPRMFKHYKVWYLGERRLVFDGKWSISGHGVSACNFDTLDAVLGAYREESNRNRRC